MSMFTKATRLDPAVRYPDLQRRFLARVEVDTSTGCWEWMGYRDWRGYPRLGRRHAHRVAYEMFVGPIPDGLHIDHLCRNVSCVFHGHLEAVTQAENNRRQWAARGRATRCRRGHAYAEHGVRDRKGYFVCAACRRESAAARRAVAT